MKKSILTMLLILSIAFTFVACQTNNEQPSSNQSNLPVYVPGSIKLVSPEKYDGTPKKYRAIYYTITGTYWERFDNKKKQKAFEEEFETWYTTENYPKEDEMFLVSYIKHFNITREEFEKMVEKDIKFNEEMGYGVGDNVLTEDHEIPNADIIYTFDNDIINEYYRYE